MKFRSRSDQNRRSYRDYIGPQTGQPSIDWAAARLNRVLGDLVMWIPDPGARNVIEEALVVMAKSPYGPAGFSMVPLNLARFQHPLFKLPAGEVAFSLWLFPRSVPIAEASDHGTMKAETRGLFEMVSSAGGKGYIAHSALPLSPSDWEDHFGPDTWKRLSDAKKEFDPNHVLSPGPGIFAVPSVG